MAIKEGGAMRHIGILGSTADGAALCYRTICQEADRMLGHYRHPEMTLHNLPLRQYIDRIDQDDWSGVADLLSQSAHKLAAVGADFIICPNNTLHQALDEVVSPIPWIHIADVVAAEVHRRQIRRVGLLGTRSVMESTIYQTRLKKWGIDQVLPEPADRQLIHDIIRHDLLHGRYSTSSREQVRRIIRALRRQAAEAIILGCTELPLLLFAERADADIIDSTRLLAAEAVRYAVDPRHKNQWTTAWNGCLPLRHIGLSEFRLLPQTKTMQLDQCAGLRSSATRSHRRDQQQLRFPRR